MRNMRLDAECSAIREVFKDAESRGIVLSMEHRRLICQAAIKASRYRRDAPEYLRDYEDSEI